MKKDKIKIRKNKIAELEKNSKYRIHISVIDSYPKNYKHLECSLEDNYDFDEFEIRLGEDQFTYVMKNGSRVDYNSGYKTTKNWIITLKNNADNLLKDIFEPNESENLEDLLDYMKAVKIEYLEKKISKNKELLKTLKNIK